MKLTNIFRKRTRFYCHYPFTSVFVTIDGKVRPCCYGAPCGDLHTASLEEIWNNQAMRRKRQALLIGDLDAADCRDCGWMQRRDLATFPFSSDLGQTLAIKNNIEDQRNEYKKGKNLLKSLPAQAIIQLTMNCNHRCQMCFQTHTTEHLPEDILRKCLAIDMTFDNIQFTGGEPFVSKWLQSYLEDFDCSRNQMIGFSTNASLLHRFKDKLDKVPRLLLGISAHSGRKETYEAITQCGNWGQFVENVTWYAHERRKRRPLWNAGRLAYVVMKNNYEEIPVFLNWAAKLEMQVMFSPVWGENARSQNIFEYPELRKGLTPPDEMWRQASERIETMPDHERQETAMSLRYTLRKLLQGISL